MRSLTGPHVTRSTLIWTSASTRENSVAISSGDDSGGIRCRSYTGKSWDPLKPWPRRVT